MSDLKTDILEALDDNAGDTDKQVAALEEIVERTVKKKTAPPGILSAVGWSGEPTPAARDPVEVMRKVFKDDAFDENEKYLLFMMSNQRFLNRRRMAYISLYSIVAGAIFIVLAILLDRFAPAVAPAQSMSAIIETNKTVITWIGGFFTSIVAFYFGASSLRPTS